MPRRLSCKDVVKRKKRIDMKTEITINSNITWKLLKEKVVAVNLDDGNYFTFNPTASMIWQYVDSLISLDEIERNMIKEFPETDPEQIKTDIKETIDYWLSEKLISIK